MICSLGHLKLKQTLTSYMFWDTTAMWDSAEKITFHSLLQNKFSKIFILSWNEWWNKSIQFVLSPIVTPDPILDTSLPVPFVWSAWDIKNWINKYGSVQELRSTFRQFYFVLVMFQLGSEWKGLAWLLVEFCLVSFGLYCWVWFGFGFGLVELGLVSLSLIYTSQD